MEEPIRDNQPKDSGPKNGKENLEDKEISNANSSDKSDKNDKSNSKESDGEKTNKGNEVYEDSEYTGDTISSIPLDRNLIKKRGFLISFNDVPDAKAILDTEVKKIEKRYDDRILEFKNAQINRVSNREESYKITLGTLTALEKKKADYESEFKSDLKAQKDKIAKEITTKTDEITTALKELGKLKETVAASSIKYIGEQLTQITTINEVLETKQNEGFKNEFNTDKAANDKRKAFFEDLLASYTDHYNLSTGRLKILNKDGINSQISSFLIFLGAVAALVSGWWFSVFTGPKPKADANGFVVGNSNARLFILDNLGKYLGTQPISYVLIGLLIYILGVGMVSWVCYRLLILFGFIEKTQQKRQKNGTDLQNEAPDEMAIDLNEENDIIKGRFKVQNWLAFWLKFAPFVAATIPILALISQQAAADPTNGGFQNLFDSMINQSIGTCIAVSCSVFTILFFSRITENVYHDQKLTEKKSGFTYIAGFLIYAGMIVSMFLYRKALIHDIRTVSIFGFLVGCMATGFSLGYGYLFRSLEENVEFLLARINLISTIIDNYSKPLRVYYSSNFRLRSRIYELQQKMMDVVQFRQDLAVAIAGGYRLAHLVKKPEPKPQPKTEENKTPKSALQSILDTIGDIVKLKWISDKEKEKKESEKHKVTHNMSDVDLTYFSEKSEQITQLNEQLRELKLKQEKLDADELDFARTQGVWQSIKDQISNAEQKRSYMANMITKTKQGIAVEVEKLERLKTEEITLLTEGYYTGLWFKDIDKSTDKKLLWQ